MRHLWLAAALVVLGGCPEPFVWDGGPTGVDQDADGTRVRPVDPGPDGGPPEWDGGGEIDGEGGGGGGGGLVAAGGACACDSDCEATGGRTPLCIHGICGVESTDSGCPAGSTSGCPAGHRCWSGTGRGVCYPDYASVDCAGLRDGDGSCVTDGSFDCYRSCGELCDLPGEPPGGGDGGDGDGDTDGDVDGDSDVDGDVDPEGLGTCTGTEAECLAAQVINDYRAGHIHAGECNTPLRWSQTLGDMAHEHQSGPWVRHSNYGYVENVGQNYGVEATAEYIIQFEPFVEPHCALNGSYVMSHHCAAMFCNNVTVGVGVYQQGETTYMTMIFGDADSNPSW